jgi:ribosome-associated protein
MEDPIRIGRDVAIPLAEIVLRASRSSGPGGQHANVTASASLTEAQKARIIARAGPRVIAVAQDARGQARNRELALERLRRRLAAALAVQRPRHATKPSRAAKQRRLEAKRQQADRKRARRRPGADEH